MWHNVSLKDEEVAVDVVQGLPSEGEVAVDVVQGLLEEYEVAGM
jgi:hypothetical protein